MSKEEARQIIATWLVSSKGAKGQRGYIEGWFDEEDVEAFRMAIEALSAEAVHIHNDGTLEVKVPNAQKVGRVLIMDTNSHIGGGLFYPDEAVQGEWINIDNYYRLATCSHCHKVTMFEKWGEYTRTYNYCPNCGAKMTKGGDDE